MKGRMQLGQTMPIQPGILHALMNHLVTATRKDLRMDLLILTHLLIGVLGVFVGVRLMTAKWREHENIQKEENSDERLADFHTVRVSTGLGSRAPAMKDTRRKRDAA
jgi:hypothetical protein